MEIDIKQVLLQVFNFSVLMLVLNKYLYKPVLKVLKDREDSINEGMTAAAKNITDQEEMGIKSKAELTKARRKATVITKDATSEAKKQAKEILVIAKKEAKDESVKLQKSLEVQTAQKEKAMQSELGGLVVETTKSLLTDLLSDKEVEKITKATIKKLG